MLWSLQYSKWKPRSCLLFKHCKPSCISPVRTFQHLLEYAIHSPLINVSRVFLKTHIKFRGDLVPGAFWSFCEVRERVTLFHRLDLIYRNILHLFPNIFFLKPLWKLVPKCTHSSLRRKPNLGFLIQIILTPRLNFACKSNLQAPTNTNLICKASCLGWMSPAFLYYRIQTTYQQHLVLIADLRHCTYGLHGQDPSWISDPFWIFP